MLRTTGYLVSFCLLSLLASGCGRKTSVLLSDPQKANPQGETQKALEAPSPNLDPGLAQKNKAAVIHLIYE